MSQLNLAVEREKEGEGEGEEAMEPDSMVSRRDRTPLRPAA
eukprot:g17248.t1